MRYGNRNLLVMILRHADFDYYQAIIGKFHIKLIFFRGLYHKLKMEFATWLVFE